MLSQLKEDLNKEKGQRVGSIHFKALASPLPSPRLNTTTIKISLVCLCVNVYIHLHNSKLIWKCTFPKYPTYF